MKAEASTAKVVISVTLTLTAQEARWLRDLMGYIGGDPRTSRRRHADDLIRALAPFDLGPEIDDVEAPKYPGSRSLYFKEQC